LFTYAQNTRLPPVLSYMDQIKANARRLTIEQLILSLSQGILPSEYVLIDAVLSQFDIDADPLSCFTFKWFQIFVLISLFSCCLISDTNLSKRCNIPITHLNRRKCANKNCQTSEFGYYKTFDMLMNVSDHTGTLNNLRMSANTFEKLMECSVGLC